MIDKVEDTLNGGYAGLFGEVVTEDIYKLREVKFHVDVVFDMGANVGCFARYARELFPDALIVCVEPDPSNFYYLAKFTDPENIIFLNKAIGNGKIFRHNTASNGSGECYVSENIGYPEASMKIDARLNETVVKTVMPSQLINDFVGKDMKFLVKMDIEGNELAVFEDEESMNALRKADYFTGEVHYYALTGNLIEVVKEKTLLALHTFDDTHEMAIEHVNFYATKK